MALAAAGVCMYVHSEAYAIAPHMQLPFRVIVPIVSLGGSKCSERNLRSHSFLHRFVERILNQYWAALSDALWFLHPMAEGRLYTV
jgi:hypothetical protein